MKLIIVGSNSAGNCYILEGDKESLLIECGLNFKRIKQAMGFDLSKAVGCVTSHEHKDHCAAVNDVLKAGIRVFASAGTHKAMGTINHHNATVLSSDKKMSIGSFSVRAFKVNHDAAEPVGFLIHHEECGTVLFLTDTYYCNYTFPHLNNIIVEANYSQEILDSRLRAGESPEFLRNRVIQSHMSLETCKQLLRANDLRQVNNIVLIHLSDGNSDAVQFKREVEECTGKAVHVAIAGMVIENFNKQPF